VKKPASPAPVFSRRGYAGFVGTLVLLAFVGLFVRACAEESPQAPTDKQLEEIRKRNNEVKQETYAKLSPEDERGFTRMAEPKHGEWLYHYLEKPQPFEAYKVAGVPRPTEDRRTLVLQPLGKFNEEQKKVLQALREYAEVFFQLPARLEEPLEIKLDDPAIELSRAVPMGQRHGDYDKQYHAPHIMDLLLKPKLPKDACAYLGITMEDLYTSDTSYVFGIGSMRHRVGVYSLARYYPEFWGEKRRDGDAQLALLRAFKVLNHETGHMFGLTHCVFFKCTMNGSNSLDETDSTPLHLCPICTRKLEWNIGFNAVKQYEQLTELYKKYDLKSEADWQAARLERFKALRAKKDDRNE
jgi:archaemetzincin